MPTLPVTTVDFFLAGLGAFMKRSGQGEHWAVTVLQLKGKPDTTALTRAWEQVHAHHPMLGARMKRVFRGWRLAWETSGPSVAPPVIWHPPQAEPPNEFVIQERLQGRHGAGNITTPLWMEVFPSSAGPEHVIVLTWRHALMDGTGVNLLLEKLATGSCASGPPAQAMPDRKSMGLVFQKARPLMLRLHAMTKAGCLSAWKKGMPTGGSPQFRLIKLSAEQSQAAFARLRSSCGEFLQMPFYAAIAGRALRLLHEMRSWYSPEIHLHLPIQSRGRSRDHIFGNGMGALPVFLDAPALGTMDDAVTHVLAKYREAMKQDMPQASEALMTLAAQLPVKWFISAVRLTNRGQICSLFHSHTGTFLPGRAEFVGAAIQNVYTIPGVCSPPGLGVFFSDYAGCITVTLAWRGDGMSEMEVAAVSRQIQTDLTGQPTI